MNIDINKLKSYTNKKFNKFLVNYYKKAYEAGYNRAIEHMNEAIKKTKGVGLKTQSKIANTFEEVSNGWIQIEQPDLRE